MIKAITISVILFVLMLVLCFFANKQRITYLFLRMIYKCCPYKTAHIIPVQPSNDSKKAFEKITERSI